MTAVIFRRRALGNTSTMGITGNSTTGITIQTHNRIRRVARREGEWPVDTSLVFRWGCTARIPVNCNNVVNTCEAIRQVNDKAGFRALLMEHLELNGTQLCPRTWSFDDYFDHALPHLPVVIRPRNHAQGRQFYVCHTHEDVERAVGRCTGGYVSELINKAAEYRVFVCQGRVVWVARKTPGNPNDVAWNVARGGRFDHVRWGDWPLRVVRVAVEGMALTDLDFGGVDVIVDNEGRAYIVEINSAPSQTSPHRQECVARAFDYIVRNGKTTIPLTPERGGWRKFIHPGVCDEAIMLNTVEEH